MNPHMIAAKADFIMLTTFGIKPESYTRYAQCLVRARDLETSRIKTRPVDYDLPFKFVFLNFVLFQVNIIFKNI